MSSKILDAAALAPPAAVVAANKVGLTMPEVLQIISLIALTIQVLYTTWKWVTEWLDRRNRAKREE